MFKWGAYAESASAGRMSRTGPIHISKIVLSIVIIGPPSETRTPRKDRCAKDHNAPSHISKMVPPTIHLGPGFSTK